MFVAAGSAPTVGAHLGAMRFEFSNVCRGRVRFYGRSAPGRDAFRVRQRLSRPGPLLRCTGTAFGGANEGRTLPK